MVAGRQIGVVVDGNRVLTEAPRRLDHQHHVACLQRGDHDLTIAIVTSVDEKLARWRAPVRDDRVGQFGRQRGEPVAIVLGRQPNRIAAELAFGEPVRVLAAALDQGMDQARRRPWHRRRRRRRWHIPHRAWPAAARRRSPGCPTRRRCRCGRAWSGYAENTSATRFSDAGIARSRACLTANPATRAQRSGSAT